MFHLKWLLGLNNEKDVKCLDLHNKCSVSTSSCLTLSSLYSWHFLGKASNRKSSGETAISPFQLPSAARLIQRMSYCCVTNWNETKENLWEHEATKKWRGVGEGVAWRGGVQMFGEWCWTSARLESGIRGLKSCCPLRKRWDFDPRSSKEIKLC